MSQKPETNVIRQRLAECSGNKRPFSVTEAEWLACQDPRPLLEFLKGKVSERKLALFSVACYRRIWHRAGGPCRAIVEAVEQFADEGAGDEKVASAYEAWISQVDKLRGQPNDGAGGNTYVAIQNIVCRGVPFAEAVSDAIMSAVAFTPPDILDPARMADESAAHAALVRDLIGNSFHALSFDAASAVPEILDLCQAIIQEQRFDRMPILGGLLRDAGCRDESILTHCRETIGHVRGCWVLDLLTNKR